MIQKHKLIFLSLASGLILALSWPAGGFPFLAFVALVPLFFMESHILEHRRDYHRYSVFLYSWLAFGVFNLLTTWWILFATIPGMIVAVLLNSLFMALPWALMHYARRLLPGKQGVVTLVLFWLTFERLHSLWELSWSWLDLGNVFATVPRWVQWYEYTGVAGGTLWVLAINILAYLLLSEILSGRPRVRRLFWHGLFLLAGILIPLLLSLQIWNNYEEKHDPAEVVIVQPGRDPYQKAESAQDVMERVQHMLELARSKVSPQTRFVVAPEGASPSGIWIEDEERHPMVFSIRQFQEDYPRAAWVFGSFSYQMYYSPNQASRSARPYGDSGRFYDAYNSAVMVPFNAPVQYYHKSKLVPGIERMPFFTYLGPVGRMVERFGGIAGSLGTQDQRSVFDTEFLPAVAPVICYESIYGDYMREYMLRGASMIFVITNDGWWRDTPGYRQHNQYARLRAIEFRRSIARSASTGISSFIDQKGNIIKSTNWWEADAMAENLNQNQRLTFFTIQGNFLGKLAVFLTILLIFYMISQRIIARPGQKSVVR